jgi:hypothetical protein
MLPIRIEIPLNEGPAGAPAARKDFLVCTRFTVSLENQRIDAEMHVEQLRLVTTTTPVLDAEGQKTGINEITEQWQPFCRYHPTGKYAVRTHSDVHKFVDSNLQLVEATNPAAIPEVLAIWSLLGPGVEQIITGLMSRMVSRGNLDDLSQL